MAESLVADDLGACPFCGKELAVDHANYGILHALPTCPTYDKLEVNDFLTAVRKERERQLNGARS